MCFIRVGFQDGLDIGRKAGQRRLWAVSEDGPDSLDFYGLCNRKGILKLDAEVSNSAVHLRMAQQQLHCAKVARLFVDLRYLGPSHRMRAVCACLKANRRHPVTDDPRILAGGDGFVAQIG